MEGLRGAIQTVLISLALGAAPVQAIEDDPATLSSSEGDLGPRTIVGTVVSTLNASGYTYVQVDTDGGIVWTAVPRVSVKEGDRVSIPNGYPMPGFYSPSLDRRFEVIYLAPSLRILDRGGAPPIDLGERCPPSNKEDTAVDTSGIEPPQGGKTISDLFSEKTDLDGRMVTLRGVVVKCTTGILGKTWIQLRDDTSGPSGVNDLTIAARSGAAIGATVLVKGTVAVDRDYGYGHRYDLLIEDAVITAE